MFRVDWGEGYSGWIGGEVRVTSTTVSDGMFRVDWGRDIQGGLGGR